VPSPLGVKGVPSEKFQFIINDSIVKNELQINNIMFIMHYPVILSLTDPHFSWALWFEEHAIYILSSREEDIFYNLTKTIDEAISVHACIL
jgi:hypothetical protein